MPGNEMGIGLMLIPTQRLEMRLEQRLTMMQILDIACLEQEKGFNEQRKVLEKIKKDIEHGVYTRVSEFHDRIMKRIKKPDRTEAVKELIKSIRNFIDQAEIQEKEINMGTILLLVNLGLECVCKMRSANQSYDAAIKLSEKVIDPLVDILRFGMNIITQEKTPHTLIENIISIEKKTKGEISIQVGYNQVKELMINRESNRKALINIINDILGKKRNFKQYRIEALFRLAEEYCELAIPEDHSLSCVPGALICKIDLGDFLNEHPNIPLPILSELLMIKLSQEGLIKMNELAGTKKLRKKRDYRRAFLNTFITLRNERGANNIIEDVLNKAKGVTQARDILIRIAGLARMKWLNYNFDLPDGDAIYKYLEKKGRHSNPVLEKLEQLNSEAYKKFHEMISNNHRGFYFDSFQPILELGKIYKHTYPNGIFWLAKLLESLITNNYHNFRYLEDGGKECMTILQGHNKEWIENSNQWKLLGDLEGLKPQLNAIKQIAEELKESYEKAYGIEITEESVMNLMIELDNQLAEFEQKEHPEEMKQAINDLEVQAQFAHTIYSLINLTLEEILEVRSKITPFYLLNQFKKGDQMEDFIDKVDSIKTITYSTQMQMIMHISIRDTDDSHHLIDSGCTPVKTCQRWNEKTYLNSCLLALCLDSNKRLVQAIDMNTKVRVRSILRLIDVSNIEEIEGLPVLFLEKPYANISSPDLLKSMVGCVIEKAHRMSKEKSGSIVVAVQDPEYKKILKEIANQAEIDFSVDTFESVFISRNSTEYSDAFGGKVLSGTEVKADRVGYIIIEAD